MVLGALVFSETVEPNNKMAVQVVAKIEVERRRHVESLKDIRGMFVHEEFDSRLKVNMRPPLLIGGGCWHVLTYEIEVRRQAACLNSPCTN